ncbi:MAG TPA: pyrimidine 5'-nucleotidase [Anaerolineaceae bacterium]|nr:pyrimidine 5'-nucleotidase [Anaerolineaceae bacterium]HPN52729.1 pyrimidine 5'-nucleotidase [Anaerolineaceae bacterium]
MLNLKGITTLLIDLDDTLYPAEKGIWQHIRDRMDLYLTERLDINPVEVPVLRKHLFETYGTTLRGLQLTRNVDEEDFLAFVHDVNVEIKLQPNQRLAEILKRYPQRRFILTNADKPHADRVLRALGLVDCFEDIIDIHTLSPFCKPQLEAYHQVLTYLKVRPDECLFADDSTRNLGTAHSLGMLTVLVGSKEPASEADFSIQRIEDLPLVFPFPSGR